MLYLCPSLHQYISGNNLASIQGKFFELTQHVADLLSVLIFSLQISYGYIFNYWERGSNQVHKVYVIDMTLEALKHEYFPKRQKQSVLTEIVAGGFCQVEFPKYFYLIEKKSTLP